MSKVNIAIDGPAASGKGTVARGVAHALGFQYVDTGAMFRAVAVLALRAGIPFNDEARLAHLVNELDFRFEWKNQHLVLFVDNEEMTALIRTEAAGLGASLVSQAQSVRTALLIAQRNMARLGGVVMDGRDIGTVVLPEAEVKVFLVADVRVRAERRFQELMARGESTTFDAVLKELVTRDEQDQNRKIAPLKKAADATELDSTKMDASGVIKEVLALARQYQTKC